MQAEADEEEKKLVNDTDSAAAKALEVENGNGPPERLAETADAGM